MKSIDGSCIIVPLFRPITEDESVIIEMPHKLFEAIRHSFNCDWPRTWPFPKYVFMREYKHYASANRLRMTWGLKPASLECRMGMTNIQYGVPWAARSTFIEGIDRLLPVIHLLSGGETAAKNLLRK